MPTSIFLSSQRMIWPFHLFRDACAAPGTEYNNENICSGNHDSIGRKSSLLSSASDYARSISAEQQTNINRASSPSNDKTVSFFDERIKVKSK
jgi:hypothetical protein